MVKPVFRRKSIGTKVSEEEYARAGMRNARAKGKKLGRPRVLVDAARIARLNAQGHSIQEIAEELGYSRSLVHKSLANGKARGVVKRGWLATFKMRLENR